MRMELLLIPLLLLAVVACTGKGDTTVAPEGEVIQSEDEAAEAVTDISDEVGELTDILDGLDADLG